MPYNDTIRVFEHQRIVVDQEIDGIIFTKTHFETLCHWVSQQALSFFTVEPNAIRFKSYVGVIQSGPLCIEILPKLDQWLPNKEGVQGCLIDMLRQCRFLKVSTFDHASLLLRPLPLMDLFWSFFLEEVAALLKEGLLRSYTQKRGEQQYLKGRLLLEKQLQLQGVNKLAFHTVSTTYDYNHPCNIALYQALQVLKSLPLSPAVQQLLGQVLSRFPRMANKRIAPHFFEHLQFDLKTQRYNKALRLASMVLQQRTPDVRGGSQSAIALLFDMNVLFEEYVYQQLLRSVPAGIRISHQENRLFWLRRSIRPDIVIRSADRTIVIDTKWKLLQKGQPSMEDLRQMYIYNKYFRADKGILLYPKLSFSEAISSPFHAVGDSVDHGICEVNYVELVKEGKLNLGLGTSLWQQLSLA